MQIPVLNGIYTDASGEFRTSYPRNLVPVPKKQGISNGYLRPADGIALLATGPGVDRGGINWNGVCYRAMGSKLVKVDAAGTLTVIGDIGGTTTPVSFDYSFDRLAVASAGKLWYYDGTTLAQVTDTDLGTTLDVLWVDGYFMTTDGTSLVVTELTDPFSVNPLKYGSAEVDPDPIKCLLKLRDEVCAVGRYTVEVFDNIGGSLFPFSRNAGAQMVRGAIGTDAACIFSLTTYNGIAFLGSARNEPPAVWFGVNGITTPLSTREVDTILQGYTEAQLSTAVLEPRMDKNHRLLYLHLPDQTLVYDASGSAAVGEPVWYILTSSLVGKGQYRARGLVWAYDKWISGDPTGATVGVFVDNISSHYGTANGWEFGTVVVYNESAGAIFHEVELIALAGHVALNVDPTIWTSYSLDGETWSQERPRSAGKQGRRAARLSWLQQGNMRNWRIQRFRGTSDAHLSIARIEAKIEGLAV
jgi:hypothetical protein